MTDKELERIIDRYSRLLWSVAAPILDGAGSEQDAEECVADVFIDLWRDPVAFDEARGNLRNYLCMRCRNKAIDRFRRLTARFREELNEETIGFLPDLAETFEAGSDAEAVRRAVLSLNEPAREIMIRRFFLDQKPARIAKAMGLSVRSVTNAIYRTKEKLKERLRDTV